MYPCSPALVRPRRGSVFDVRPDGTATGPGKLGVRVSDAAAFAVADKSPGGVIVSRAAENLKVQMKKDGF